MDKFFDGNKEGALIAAVWAARDGMIATDPAGVVLGLNPAVERMFGYPRSEVIGANLVTLVPSIFEAPVDSQPDLTTWEVAGERRDGTSFPIEVSVADTQGRADQFRIWILRDVSDRKQILDQILRESALHKAMVNAALDGILTIDQMGVIQTVNPAVEKIFGYSPEELIGQNVRVLMPSPYHEEHDQYLTNYRETGHRKIIGIGREVRGRRRDGTEFALDLGVSETVTEQGVIFTGIVRDISERVLAVEMQIARDAAVQANAAKSEFLSRMSHELRTPLNAVLGFAQLLQMRYEDEKIQTLTRSIIKAGQHLLSLINEVLDLSRIEAGRLTLSVEPISLSQTLLQALDIVQPIADKSGVSIEFYSSACAEVHVKADRQHLLQVFINLLTNAVKFNRHGGAVEVRCKAADSRVSVYFKDTGFGIDPGQVSRLFQPFERLGDQAVEGTGLGLVLSRRFLELMGGSLNLVESTPEGSTFCIELEETSSPDRRSPGWAEKYSGMRRLHDLKGSVLYIEDNLSNMKLIEMLLDGWPAITLTPAIQGQVGLDLARSGKFDLILLDLHLPDMPGEEVLRQLKSHPETAASPVVVISADATVGQLRKLRQAGAFEYLTKPLDIDRFVHVLEILLPSDADE